MGEYSEYSRGLTQSLDGCEYRGLTQSLDGCEYRGLTQSLDGCECNGETRSVVASITNCDFFVGTKN